MEIGVRELKAKLSAYVERVGKGETVTVTVRGRPVAQLVPIPGQGALERGLEEGWITVQEHGEPEAFEPLEPLPGSPSSREILEEDRRD